MDKNLKILTETVKELKEKEIEEELSLEEKFTLEVLERELRKLEKFKKETKLWYSYDKKGCLRAIPYNEVKDSHLLRIIECCIRNSKRDSLNNSLGEWARRYPLKVNKKICLWDIYIILERYSPKEADRFRKVNYLMDETTVTEFINNIYKAKLAADTLSLYMETLWELLKKDN